MAPQADACARTASRQHAHACAHPKSLQRSRHTTRMRSRVHNCYFGGFDPGGSVDDLDDRALPCGGLKLAKRLIGRLGSPAPLKHATHSIHCRAMWHNKNVRQKCMESHVSPDTIFTKVDRSHKENQFPTKRLIISASTLAMNVF